MRCCHCICSLKNKSGIIEPIITLEDKVARYARDGKGKGDGIDISDSIWL